MFHVLVYVMGETWEGTFERNPVCMFTHLFPDGLTRCHPLWAACRSRRRDCTGCHCLADWTALEIKNTNPPLWLSATHGSHSHLHRLLDTPEPRNLIFVSDVRDFFCVAVIESRPTNSEIRSQERSAAQQSLCLDYRREALNNSLLICIEQNRNTQKSNQTNSLITADNKGS